MRVEKKKKETHGSVVQFNVWHKRETLHIDMRSINQGRGLTVVTELSRRLMLLVGTVNSNYMRHNHVLDVGEGKVSS
jgi:hypothetical protein